MGQTFSAATPSSVSGAAGTTQLVGMLVDSESKAPLAGATLRVTSIDDPKSTATGTTDGEGNFSIESPSGSLSIVADKEGYASQAQVLEAAAGSRGLSLSMTPVNFVQALTMGSDGTAEVKAPDNSISVQIPNAATALGTSGPVKAEVLVGNPRESISDFPGGLVAVQGVRGGVRGGLRAASKRRAVRRANGDTVGESVELASVVYANITLRDDAGNAIPKLNSPADVKLKIPSGSLNPKTGAPYVAGDTIQVWYIDESLGTWVPELDDAGNPVEATVADEAGVLFMQFKAKHFSWWNVDYGVETHHCIRGRIVNACGSPAKDLHVCSQGKSYPSAFCNGTYGWENKKIIPTGEDGKFCLDVMRNSTLEIQAGQGVDNPSWGTIKMKEILARKDVQAPDKASTCVNLSDVCTDVGDILIAPPTLREVRGKVEESNGRPVTGAAVSASGASGTTDDKGAFSVAVAPGDSVELTISQNPMAAYAYYSYMKLPKFASIKNTISVPGFTPAPGACETAPPVEIGKIEVKAADSANVGCVRGKITDEASNILKSTSVSAGSSYVTSDQGGNYCLEAAPGEVDLVFNYYDRGKSKNHKKSHKEKIVGGGACGGGQTKCVLADIVMEVGDSCVSGTITDQSGKGVSGATVRVGSQMVNTDYGGKYCVVAPLRQKVKVKVKHSVSAKGGGGSDVEAEEEIETGGAVSCGSCVVVNKSLEVNAPPTVGEMTVAKKIVQPGESVVVSVTASDPDGDRLSYSWLASGGELEKVKSNNGKKAPASLKGDDPQVEWKAPSQSGKYNVTVQVEDAKKATAAASVEVQVGEDKDGDGFVAGVDCDDANAKAFPKGSEVCDLADNDCNGKVDDVVQSIMSYKDVDGDGYTDGGFVQGCAPTAGYVASAKPGDCDDASKARYPGNVEACDGADNNCDGKVDEGLGGGSCSSGSAGVCASGTMKCANGVLACAANATPSAETCDGADNDCDGKTDEDTGGVFCSTGKSGLCSGGTQKCQSGALVCVQTLAQTSEVCGDGIDNDCNGNIDEVCQCASGATQTCYSGASSTKNVGLCVAGTQSCSGGLWGTCAGEVLPATESCDAKDNNCDGTVDNGLGGASCTSAQPGVCAAGTQQCQSGTTTCVANTAASTELCDSLDNDCDGNTDEDFANKGQSCTAGVGACQASGTFVCKADKTNTECSAVPGNPGIEICDGIDNNCDGNTDEGGVCTPAAPSGLTATTVSSTQINLAWTDNSNNEDGFKIEQKIGAGGAYAVVGTAGPNLPSMAIGGLTPSTQYFYRVYAFKTADNSAYSNEANATTTAGSPPAGGNIQAISAHLGDHTCALGSDGIVECWGSNLYGQLGDGTTASKATPVPVASLFSAIGIAGGYYHTCALGSDGTVRCWGYSFFGQLGDGTTVSKSTPVAVSTLTGAVAIAGGYSHTCALGSDGTVKCWGWNSYRQLGDGTAVSKSTPVAVSTLAGAIAIAAGLYHTCALGSDGSVKCWGDNAESQLGDGTTAGKGTPVLVTSLSSAIGIVGGSVHTCALGSDGTAKCWGYNADGELGDGTTVSKSTPVAVSTLTGTAALTAGRGHTCALGSDGTVKCWGDSAQSQLGDGTTVSKSIPVAVSTLTGAIALAGGGHTCALGLDGMVKCWGPNVAGQLGDGTTINRSTPVAVTGLSGPVGVKLPRLHEGSAGRGGPARPWHEGTALGAEHTCALRSDGMVKCWGANNSGQLGDGTTTGKLTPTTVISLSGIVSISGSFYHYCALVSGGQVRCWGRNDYAQLGDGTTIDRTTPVAVSSLSNVVAISSGGTSLIASGHICALLSNGTAKCWGYNGYGQLGDGTLVNKASPVPFSNLSNIVSISGGDNHTCALLADGTVRCAGYNVNGQLGDGTTINRLNPVPVTGLSGVVSINANYQHTCALISDGSARCWGQGNQGKLGDGTSVSKWTPVQVSSLTAAVQLAGQVWHNCALLADGSAKCWGYNSWGNLGDGTAITRSAPVPVSGLTGAVWISTGGDHSCAQLADGSMRCWGKNYFGQLGNGTTSTGAVTTPVPVLGLP